MVASPARAVGFFMALASIFVANMAMAVDPVFKMGDPTFFGSGCLVNTVKIATSRDGQSVSIRFSAFNASTTPILNRDRKSCSLAVPVAVLPGISIGVFQVDYRGHAFVPPVTNAYTEFQANYFFAGATGPTYKKTWNASSNEDLVISNKLGVSAIIWSPCGQSANLRINTSLMAYKPKLSDADPVIAIDTTDVSIERGFRFYATYRRCVAASQPTKNP